MGSIFTIIIFSLIIIYSFFQVRKVYRSYKIGKCEGCSYKSTCDKETCQIELFDVDDK